MQLTARRIADHPARDQPNRTAAPTKAPANAPIAPSPSRSFATEGSKDTPAIAAIIKSAFVMPMLQRTFPRSPWLTIASGRPPAVIS